MREARQFRAGLAVVAVLLLASCASMPPDRIAYNSIDGAKASVTAAVKAWGELYAQGKYTDADREKVKAAYEKFGAAVAVAADIAMVATDKEQKANALAYVNAAAFDILRLLREFEVVK